MVCRGRPPAEYRRQKSVTAGPGRRVTAKPLAVLPPIPEGVPYINLSSDSSGDPLAGRPSGTEASFSRSRSIPEIIRETREEIRRVESLPCFRR